VGNIVWAKAEGQIGASFTSQKTDIVITVNPQAPDHLRDRIYLRLPAGKTLEDLSSIEVSRLLDKRPGHDALFLFENTAFCFNGWRAFKCGFLDWDSAGIKISWAEDVVYRDCVAVGNKAAGFWHDISCARIKYERCFAYGNAYAGIFFELSGAGPKKGGDLAIHCVSAYSEREGFLLGDVRNPKVTECLIVNNKGGGVRNREMTSRRPNTREEIGSVTIFDNTIYAAKGQALLTFYTPEEIIPVTSSDNNRYFTSDPDQAFEVGDDKMGFAQWKERLAVSSGKRQSGLPMLNWGFISTGESIRCRLMDRSGIPAACTPAQMVVLESTT